jgi:hypothetical protein
MRCLGHTVIQITMRLRHKALNNRSYLPRKLPVGVTCPESSRDFPWEEVFEQVFEQVQAVCRRS